MFEFVSTPFKFPGVLMGSQAFLAFFFLWGSNSCPTISHPLMDLGKILEAGG